MWFKNISFQYSQRDLGKTVDMVSQGFFSISDICRYKGLNLDLTFLKTCRFCLLHCWYIWSPKTMQNCSKGSCFTALISQEFVSYCVISSYLYFTESKMLEAEGSDMIFKRDEILCSCSKRVLSRCDGKIHKTSTNPGSHKPWAEC